MSLPKLAPPTLTLAEARAIVDRAVEKARELTLAGTFVVVDEGGNVLSISRMDGAPPAGVGTSRAKAYVAAVTHEISGRFASRMHAYPERFAAYQEIFPEVIFPGPGAVPIRKGGRVVGAISTGPGIGPRTSIPGVDPAKLMVNGEPANAEDLIIAHALGVPYVNQHDAHDVRHKN